MLQSYSSTSILLTNRVCARLKTFMQTRSLSVRIESPFNRLSSHESPTVCASSPLSLEIKKQKCGWKAPGGHSWAYSVSSGAHVAVVCEATCPRCRTVYKLQTYTPGPAIDRGSGVTTEKHPVQQQSTPEIRHLRFGLPALTTGCAKTPCVATPGVAY